jgi:hypothetical protein
MKFTFGIVTAGTNDILLENLINSIYLQQIPEFEIIIVGSTSIKQTANIILIPFDESIRSGWITKKKNIIYNRAKYDNLIMVHDYYLFSKGWYNGFLTFGDDYDVCVNKILTINGERYIDYLISPFGLNGVTNRRHFLPYDLKLTPQLSRLCYISGGYYCIKKDIALKYLYDERLSYNLAEDMELFQRLGSNNITIKFNNFSEVTLQKYKERWDWESQMTDNEVISFISLSESECNTHFNEHRQALRLFLKGYNIIL